MYIHSNGTAVLAFGKVSATLIVTLLLQGAAVIVWATHLDSLVDNIERQSVNAVILNEKFARLDERMEFQKQQLAVISEQLEQINKRFSRSH